MNRGEGPSRGLLWDCETSNFAKVCFQLEFVVTFSVVHIPNSLKLSYKTFPNFFPDKAASKSWRQIADFCDL